MDVNPQVVFTIFGIGITDTVVSTWVMMALVLGLAFLVGRLRPSILELVFDFINDTVSELMGQNAGPALPFIGSIALFILGCNLIGEIPGLKTPTADINTPIAISLCVFLSVHYFGIRAKGFVRYFKELASPIFLLPIELISQFSRTISLTLRLFGNMVSGEYILAILLSIVPLIAPLPIIALHVFTGLLQAYIFTALATVYIASAILTNEG